METGDYYEEPNIKGKVFSIALIAFFAFSLFCFTTNMVYKASPFVNGKYYVSVNSDSMSQAISSNNYLETNNLKNQIAQYNIAVVDPCDGSIVNQYDVILFKKNGNLIIHRVIEIDADGNFITKGDKNLVRDDWVVTKEEVIGKYSYSLVFMSFINYLGYTPGFYVALAGVTYDLGVILYFQIKKDKALKKYQNGQENI